MAILKGVKKPMIRKYYGALVNDVPDSIPPVCLCEPISARVYADKDRPDFVILTCDSHHIRETCREIARRNGCEVWDVKRSCLRKSEVDAGIRVHNHDAFQRNLEHGHIFPMVDIRFEKIKATVKKYGWFRCTGVISHKWSRIVTGSRETRDLHHFTVNYHQMQALNEMLKEQDGDATG